MIRAAALLATLLVATTLAPARAAEDDLGPIAIAVPLDEGRLDVGAVVAAIHEALGFAPPPVATTTAWRIDPGTALGAAQIDLVEIAAARALEIETLDGRAILAIDRGRIADRFGPGPPGRRAWLERTTDRLVARGGAGASFGVSIVEEDDDRVPAGVVFARDGALPPRLVILVHGLDEPGYLWRDAIPALRAAGHVVARFEYPNDGPIAASADRFAEELLRLRRCGVREVDVVAHSMGGLVTRDLLTRPAHYGGDAGGGTRFPAIPRFVMLGTPNHGSELARLRGVSEVREQVVRAFTGNGGWLAGVADGSGEAGRDLIPGSAFLQELNARPLPRGVAITIVAGRVSPIDEGALDGLERAVRRAADDEHAPAWLAEALRDAGRGLRKSLDATVRGLGDGCVSIDSAGLAGVSDVVIVEANHLSMVVDLAPGDAPPAALPIVIDRLSSGDE